jgi:hypothetical protein
MNSRKPVAILLMAVLAGCATPPTPAAVGAVASDVTALEADIQTAAAGKTLTQAQLATITGQLTMLQTDVTALNAGKAGVTVDSVLADVTTTADVLGPFLPEIAALVSLAGPKSGMTYSKPLADYSKLKADVAAAH